MLRKLLIALLLAAAATGACRPGQAIAGDSVGQLLARADAVRSADRAAFDSLLRQARDRRESATADERDLLDLLTAYQLSFDGRYTEAMGLTQRLFVRGHSAEIRYRAALLTANTAALVRDSATGLRYLALAMPLEKRITSPELRSTGAIVAATLYNQFGQPEIALQYASSALAAAPTPRTRCFAEENRMRALVAMGRGTREEFLQSIEACDAIGETLIASIARVNYARSLSGAGQHRAAIDVVARVVPTARATRYSRLMGELYDVVAKSRLALGDHAAAERAANEILAIEGQHPHWAPVITAHRVLFTVAEARGDHAKALEHFRAHHVAERGNLDEIKAREQAFLMTRLGALEKEQQARVLQHQNQALRLEQSVSIERARTLRLAIVILCLVVGAVAYWAWQFRRTHSLLRRMSEQDALTGIASRAHFSAKAEAVIAACEQQRRPVSMLMIDLDHFKQINDLCSHAVGDWVLREVARACAAECPAGAFVGRIGGEEFAMVLDGLTGEQAMRIAEQVRTRIAAIDAMAGGCHLPITASIGVASSDVSGYDYARLLGDADVAMYSAKRDGKNAVHPARPSPTMRDCA